jgi:hypothetical protein
MAGMKPLAAFVISSALAAQTVCVSGEIAPLTGPTICQQGETHRLAGTDVFLRSSTVDLNSLVGHNVEVQGTDVGLLCRLVDVSQVLDPTPVTLVHCGNPMTGCPLRVVVQGPGLGFAILGAAFGSDFAPLGCGNNPGDLHGTLLLAAPVAVLAAAATGTGRLEQNIPIPANGALTGLQVLFQGAHMTVGRQGPLRLANSVRVTLVPLLPPCGIPGC